jgi:hypothetical protein
MKTVQGVAYRHNLLTAYVKVCGTSIEQATVSAKEVRKALGARLPEALVLPPRYKGEESGLGYIFSVPAVIAKCPNLAKSVIARMVLSGCV